MPLLIWAVIECAIALVLLGVVEWERRHPFDDLS